MELAKQKLDQVNLYSPVEGVIIEAGNLVVGLNITPAGSTVKILDSQSLTFNFEIDQKEIILFEKPVDLTVSFKDSKLEIKAKTIPVFFGKNGKFEVIAKLEKTSGLIPGLTGTAQVS